MSISTCRVICRLALLCGLPASLFAQSLPGVDRVRLRLPEHVAFSFERPAALARPTAEEWLPATREDEGTNYVEFGSRVILQTSGGVRWQALVKGRPLEMARLVSSNLFILQAADAWSAAQEAGRLAELPGVRAAYPVMRREASLNGGYAAKPNDPHFVPLFGGIVGQWYLENRDQVTGASLGVDLNVRAAWPVTRGEGMTLAVGDVGIELSHPELATATTGAPHHNFQTGSTNGAPLSTSAAWAHGTSCAGLAVAEGDNHYGMVGVAPKAKLASWVIFTNRANRAVLVSDEKLMEMFQFAPEVVSVQSHSWDLPGLLQLARTPLEDAGIENAVRLGRGGRGTVIVRSAGNDRAQTATANDSGYCSDPRVIAVGAVGRSGRVPPYSEPGACVLLGAPSNEPSDTGLFSTDLTEARGTVFFPFQPPFEYVWNFVFNNLGFGGTSASTPLVAGVATLVLSANTNLTYRDVQQILLLSARHFDLADPDLRVNGAGLPVSHNDGFGVPDAGEAVKLARSWSNRPPAAMVTVSAGNPFLVPDDGLRVLITGGGVPANLASIHCLPTTSPHADAPTAAVSLVDVGLATNVIQTDLTGKAALIQRGTNNFDEKINRAAQAGASFVVLYNYATNTTGSGCPGGDQLCLFGGGAVDFVPIPAVFIGYNDGLALQGLFATNSGARAQIRLFHADSVFTVTNMLLCEHVGVRVQADHPLRGDLRITLVSPCGTRSVLQQYNGDISAGPQDWTYYSTHHFLESSRGNWRVEVSDEGQGAEGSVLFMELIITGVPIKDTDADGLDDDWEWARLGSLVYGPKEDPDGDGYCNAREQLMQTDPFSTGGVFREELALWDARLARLAWPGVTNQSYQVWGGTDITALSLLTNLPGRFPETEWFTPYTNTASRFFRVRALDQ